MEGLIPDGDTPRQIPRTQLRLAGSFAPYGVPTVCRSGHLEDTQFRSLIGSGAVNLRHLERKPHIITLGNLFRIPNERIERV